MKLIVSLLISFVFFSEAASVVYASLYINEFSSGTSSDWIEIYNDSDTAEPLSAYMLRDDTASNKLELNGILSPKGFIVFEWSDRLNNTGDSIRLVKKDTEEEIDKVIYGYKENAQISAPSDTQSAGRIEDGQNAWGLFSSHTKGHNNTQGVMLPTLTPTPTETPKPTATPTKTPTLTKMSTPTPETKITNTQQPTILGSTIKPSPTPDYHVPTAVMATRTEEAFLNSLPPTKTPEVKTKGMAAVNPAIVLMGVGTLFLVSCFGYGYHSYKKGKL